jgi:phospholipid/cholesterol/gamma-HCH transport system substrate-binding protein
MRRNLIETILGAVVLGVAALFLIFAYTNASLRSVQGNEYVARFNRIDGINPGSDVKMSGIKVGTIKTVAIDPKTFAAVVHLTVDRSIELPTDSSAEVASEGLLGGKYLSLVPGADDKKIAPGGEIRFTQGPINLEEMIGQFMFSGQSAGGKDKGDGSGGGSGGAPDTSKGAPGGPTL